MSVRQSLLAILNQAPCYGYQLRAEFERRTGRTWRLNVGQVYNTLERLERDGLVRRGPADEQGLLFWEITAAGREEAGSWLTTPVARADGARDELAIKVAVAATLPDADAREVVRVQRAETTARLAALRAGQREDHEGDAESLVHAIMLDAAICTAEAELQWLDRCERRLAAHPHLALELSPERPRRGRPSRVATS